MSRQQSYHFLKSLLRSEAVILLHATQRRNLSYYSIVNNQMIPTAEFFSYSSFVLVKSMHMYERNSRTNGTSIHQQKRIGKGYN